MLTPRMTYTIPTRAEMSLLKHLRHLRYAEFFFNFSLSLAKAETLLQISLSFNENVILCSNLKHVHVCLKSPCQAVPMSRTRNCYKYAEHFHQFPQNIVVISVYNLSVNITFIVKAFHAKRHLNRVLVSSTVLLSTIGLKFPRQGVPVSGLLYNYSYTENCLPILTKYG